MSHEDILDDMSLSDDEMFDSLADDMLLEMEQEEEEVIETINPVRRAPPAAAAAPAMPMGFPFGAPARGGGGGGGMPDLSQMMSQMMPMMSQMFGGAGGGAAGMRGGGAALQQQKLSWDEIVKKHVPHNEQDEWLATIRKDEKTQRDNIASKVYGKPPSRSYHGHAKPLPNVYMESDTLLASLLNEAVRAKKAEHNATWSQYHDNIVSQLTQSGLAGVFARELKQQLRRRVESDPDYAAARKEDPTRFANIARPWKCNN